VLDDPIGVVDVVFHVLGQEVHSLDVLPVVAQVAVFALWLVSLGFV